MRQTLAPLLLLVFVLAGCAPRAPRDQADPIASGFRHDTFLRLDEAVDRAVRRGDVPGAVLCIARNDAVVYHKAFGVRDPYTTPPSPMERTTQFDVASLAKPVATASAAALASCEDRIDLAETLHGFTLDEHLRHMTDLPVYAEWRQVHRFRDNGARTPGEAILALMQHHREHGPPLPQSADYSNLAYVLVAEHIEKRVGMDLEAYLRESLWEPLGMARTTFRPSSDNIAHTQADVPAGRPFDPLADYILRTAPDRVPGHSGLFSTSRDLTRFAQSLMQPHDDASPDRRCVAEYLLSTFDRRPRNEAGPDIVAFATEPGRTPAFRVDPASRGGTALYHTGFTGTLMWIDPPTRTSVVLLTNATASGDAESWQQLRRQILEIVRGDLPPTR